MAHPMNPNLPPPPDQATQQEWISQQTQAIRAAELSMERAGTTMERMDHKNELYGHLGRLAAGDASGASPATVITQLDVLGRKQFDQNGHVIRVRANGAPALTPEPLPRTRFERLKDKKNDREASRLSVKAAERKRVRTTFGRVSGTKYNSNPNLGAATREVPKNRVERKADKRQYKNGGISARELRLSKTEPSSRLRENAEQQRTRKALEREQKSFQRTLRQPLRSGWRNRRIDRAVGKIQESHADATERRRILETMGVNVPPYQP